MCCRFFKNISNSICIKTYSLLCMAIGIIFAIWAVFASRAPIRKFEFLTRRAMLNLVFIILIFFASLLYILAGFLMLIGTRMRTTAPFVCGKALSYIFPIVSFMFILPLVFHLLFVSKLSAYVRERWPAPVRT